MKTSRLYNRYYNAISYRFISHTTAENEKICEAIHHLSYTDPVYIYCVMRKLPLISYMQYRTFATWSLYGKKCYKNTQKAIQTLISFNEAKMLNPFVIIAEQKINK